MFYLSPIFICRRIILILLFLTFSGNLQGAEGSTALLSDLDLPLMQGFREETDSRVVFDTPAGRIIEVMAEGEIPPQQVFDYYRLVLPTLAWRKTAAEQVKDQDCHGASILCLVATRDGEILKIIIRRTKDEKIKTERKTVIYFSVNPE